MADWAGEIIFGLLSLLFELSVPGRSLHIHWEFHVCHYSDIAISFLLLCHRVSELFLLVQYIQSFLMKFCPVFLNSFLFLSSVSIAMSSSVICFFLLPCGVISATTSISVSEMSWYRSSTPASSICKHSKRLFNFNWNSCLLSLSRKMLILLFFSCLINLRGDYTLLLSNFVLVITF